MTATAERTRPAYVSLRQEHHAPVGTQPPGAQYWLDGSFYRITGNHPSRWNDYEWVASTRPPAEIKRFGRAIECADTAEQTGT